MSGELYEVHGKIQYSPTVQCPDELKGEIIKVASREGDVFEVQAEAACMSKCIKSIAIANGLDAEIPFPLKKATVAKVVEYMNHHMTAPFGAIRTPLESDNLVECGATKWDNTFVSLDKDMIIELLLAASLFDIPSLFFLMSAKVAVMTKDRTADKLIKDFALSLDMGSDEEELIRQKVQETQKSRWGEGYDDSLTAIACVVSSVTMAAKRNGVLMPETEDGGVATGITSYRRASWRAAVLQDWKLLEQAPDEIRGDRELVMGVLPASSGAAITFASDELRSDRALVLAAVKHNGLHLGAAAPELRGDRAFVMEAVMISGAALGAASDDLRGSRSFLLEAARNGRGSALQGAVSSLLNDREFILEAALEDPEAFKYAAEDLRNDGQLVMEMVCQNGRALQYIPPKFKAVKEVVQAAVMKDDAAIPFVHTSRRVEMGLQLPWDSEAFQREEAERQANEGLLGGSGLVQSTRMMPASSREDGGLNRRVKLNKWLLFSGMGTITPNIGQVNYLAANSLHDRMPHYSRPEMDTVTLLQGAVGGTVGMRWKAFASADQLANASPESMLTIWDECTILKILSTAWFPPEVVAGANSDEGMRGWMLTQTAGLMQGIWTPGETQDFFSKKASRGNAGKGRSEAPEEPPAQPLARGVQTQQARPRAADASPLGGWPTLAHATPDDGAYPAEPLRKLEVCEGARVQLVRMNAGNKLNFKVGTVVKQFKDGKWKVKMDDRLGNVLVTRDRLQVLGPTAAVAAAPESMLPQQQAEVAPQITEVAAKRGAQAAGDKEAASAAAAMQLAAERRHERVQEKMGRINEYLTAASKAPGNRTVEPALLSRMEDDDDSDEPPPLESMEDDDFEDAMLLAGATAPFTAPFAPPKF